ncbi:hypothetical protein EXS57_00100 [Candidatus Kaiserbacteria bacterium]|nr:hypothetical protein [Candidatus Kaiserbacteria bacterium]
MNKKISIAVALSLGAPLTMLSIPAGLQSAHGKGFDGKTEVKSLQFGTPEGAPAGVEIGVQDRMGNSIITTADEVFALAQTLGRGRGYDVTVRKIG